MDSEKEAPDEPRDNGVLSDDERAALVSEWRKNRPDMKFRPLEGRELDIFLPFKNWLLGGLVTLVFIAGGILIASLWSVPRETKEVTATVIAAGKPNSDGYATVVVAIPGEVPTAVSYHGSAQLKQGQRVVLETVITPLVQTKSYHFKDPSDDS